MHAVLRGDGQQPEKRHPGRREQHADPEILPEPFAQPQGGERRECQLGNGQARAGEQGQEFPQARAGDAAYSLGVQPPRVPHVGGTQEDQHEPGQQQARAGQRSCGNPRGVRQDPGPDKNQQP